MTTLFLIAQLTVITSHPPLPPAQAVQVLQAARSIADRTHARSYPEPYAVTIRRSAPGDGPFGPFPRYAFPPLNCCSVYVHPRTPEVIVHVRKEPTR